MDNWTSRMEGDRKVELQKQGSTIRQERAERRKKSLNWVNLVGFAPFWSQLEKETDRYERKKLIVRKAVEYKKKNISFWKSYLDSDNKQMDKITTQSQETGADGGYCEKLNPLSSPFCKGGGGAGDQKYYSKTKILHIFKWVNGKSI